MKKSTQVLEKVFDILGEIMAILTILLYAVLYINANWSFIPENILNVLNVIKEYAALAVVAIVGFEAMVKRGFIFKFLFLIVLGFIVVMQFFPGTIESIIH